jgi:membrane-bound serine protease (ClpP class)
VVVLGGGMALKARRRPVVSGREVLLGVPGKVLQVSNEEAWAEVLGERWKVTGDRPLAAGQHIRVIGVDGLTLRVRPETDSQAQGGIAS